MADATTSDTTTAATGPTFDDLAKSETALTAENAALSARLAVVEKSFNYIISRYFGSSVLAELAELTKTP